MALKIEGVSAAVTREVEKILGGAPPDQQAVTVRRHSFWHRQDVASIVAGAEIEFFNAAPSTFATNWKQGLPNDEVFLAQALRFQVTSGYKVDGTAEADGDPYDAGVTALQIAADKIILTENGLVNMRLNDRDIIQNVYGLHNFPAGGGPLASLAAATTASTVTHSASAVNNGEAHNGNAWLFEPFGGVIVAPKVNMKCSVKYPFARTLTDAVVITASLVGVSILAR